MEADRDGAAAQAALLRAAARVWGMADAYATALTTAYRDAVAEQLVEADRRRSALVAALVDGPAPGSDTVWEIAQMLDFPFDGTFVSVSAEAVRGTQSPLPGLDAELRARSAPPRHGGLSPDARSEYCPFPAPPPSSRSWLPSKLRPPAGSASARPTNALTRHPEPCDSPRWRSNRSRPPGRCSATRTRSGTACTGWRSTSAGRWTIRRSLPSSPWRWMRWGRSRCCSISGGQRRQRAETAREPERANANLRIANRLDQLSLPPRRSNPPRSPAGRRARPAPHRRPRQPRQESAHTPVR